jgi:serine/threonine protein phosphatase PrpC
MERLIRGTKVGKSKEFGGECGFCDFFVYVKKGHEECGDSAFVYCDSEKAIVGVFDGVSGEAGAASASSVAAAAVLGFLKKHDKADEKVMKMALLHANKLIKEGLTTAVIAFLEKNGPVLLAGVGDSPVYGVSKGKVVLELPLGRPVGNKDSIFKFLYFRNLVTSVLGPSGVDIHVNMRSGKLRKDEMLILATDGLSDNLYLKVKKGYLTDVSGSEDLSRLIAGKKKPEAIARHLAKVVERRISEGKKEEKGRVLVPKINDIAIAVLRRI